MVSFLGVDSLSIRVNPRSVLLFPWVCGGFLERRIPGKNGESTPRTAFWGLSKSENVVVSLKPTT